MRKAPTPSYQARMPVLGTPSLPGGTRPVWQPAMPVPDARSCRAITSIDIHRFCWTFSSLVWVS